jgi:ABC-type transport system involved in cytochrome c biogenesis permease subunit
LTTNNRAIALGFFLFSAGILIFGMEWTEQGWGACVPRWGVTGRPAVIFLFYAILAHLRWGEERNLSPGAILSVFGGGMALLLCASIGAEWLP